MTNHLNMNEAFRRWPLGMSTFPAWADLYGAMFHEWHGSSIPFDDWLFERLRPLLEAAVRIQYANELGDGGWYDAGEWTVNAALIWCANEWRLYKNKSHIVLLDGTVIREWPIDEYDGIF